MALAGKKFTFGSKGSTSGRLMPEHFIRVNTKKSPKEFFGAEMNFSGAHDKTAQLVQSGTFDAGAIDYKTYDRLVAEKKIDPVKCFVIWTTPPYADYNFTIHPEVETRFGEGFIDKVRQALVSAPAGSDMLKAINRESIIPAKNEDFDGIKKVAVKVGLIKD